MSLKVYFPLGNPRGAKILVAAHSAQVAIEHVNLAYEDTKKPEHLARHPLGKVPALETADGPLFESNAILRYLARLNRAAGLYGSNAYEEGQVDQWVDFVTTEIEPLLVQLVVPVFGFLPIESAQAQKTTGELIHKLKALDNHLNGREFLVGTRLTIADVQLQFNLSGVFRFILGEQGRAGLVHLVKWFEHISALPVFLEHYGRPRMCKDPFPLLQVQHGKQQQQPKAEKPKAEKAKTEKPVEEKKKQEKKPKEEDDDDGEKKEKPKDPLDLLPPSTFSVDDWKRRFLASKDWKAEFQWFWENFDEQGWSCWIIYYQKAEGECTILVKASNMMNGFLQRMDPHFKKHCFAIHGIYGEEPNLEIRGAWIWRGAEIPQVMKDHPSFEYHKFVKVTKDQKELRELFENYWINQVEDESVVENLRARASSYFR